jgi:DNA-binding transcriptional MerR regulator
MNIAEVAKRFDLTPDTLRYYEKVGLIPEIGRSPGGIRNYTESDCGWIDFIKCMRGAGVQIDSLVEYVRLYDEGDASSEKRRQILIRERDRIAAQIDDMQQTLHRLDYKIENLK